MRCDYFSQTVSLLSLFPVMISLNSAADENRHAADATRFYFISRSGNSGEFFVLNQFHPASIVSSSMRTGNTGMM